MGAASWSHSVKCLKPGGALIVSGATTGDADKPSYSTCSSCSCAWRAPTMGSLDELESLIRFCADASIRPLIGAEHPVASAEEGFRQMIEGDTAGKIVFTR